MLAIIRIPSNLITEFLLFQFLVLHSNNRQAVPCTNLLAEILPENLVTYGEIAESWSSCRCGWAAASAGDGCKLSDIICPGRGAAPVL